MLSSAPHRPCRSPTRQERTPRTRTDQDGCVSLVDVAREAGVQHFVYTSFTPMAISFPLQDAKRAVEARLRDSGLTHTILRPTYFTEVWLSPAVGFDHANSQGCRLRNGRQRHQLDLVPRRRPIRRRQSGQSGGPEHDAGVGRARRSQCPKRGEDFREGGRQGFRSHAGPGRGTARSNDWSDGPDAAIVCRADAWLCQCRRPST